MNDDGLDFSGVTVGDVEQFSLQDAQHDAEDEIELLKKKRREPESFFSTLRQWLFPSNEEWMGGMMGRLSAFDYAIEQYPETPSNYVYRGEIYLKIWHYQAAIDDFEHALKLMSDEWEERDWGFVIQVMQDRAIRGLELARKGRNTQSQQDVVN